jgi:hypothetical protein
MLLSRHQNAGKKHGIKIANKSFVNLGLFKYFGTTITNQNMNQEEIKRSLNSSNACSYSFQGKRKNQARNLHEAGSKISEWFMRGRKGSLYFLGLTYVKLLVSIGILDIMVYESVNIGKISIYQSYQLS